MNQVENYTTQNYLECYQYENNAIIIHRRRSVSGILHTIFGVAVYWKVQNQPAIASDWTDVEIICIYNSIKKNKVTRRCMEALALHNSSTKVNLEYSISFISVIDSKELPLE